MKYLLYSAISASDQASDITVAAAQFVARWLVLEGIAIVAGLWIWVAPGKRGALLAAGTGLLVGIGINQGITPLWFHPRPFMVGLGHTLMSHMPEAFFPSYHVTFLWNLGVGLIATVSRRR